MKFIWEEKDIKPGRIVFRNQSKHDNRYMIAYTSNTGLMSHYCIVELTDGMIFNLNSTKEEIAGFLNTYEFTPEEVK